MNLDYLRAIIERLERHRQAVTYGALAGVVGISHRRVMSAETKSYRNSWVVNKQTRRPTGYGPEDMHPELLFGIAENGVITSATELAEWLKTHE
jgi:hypothetical protein